MGGWCTGGEGGGTTSLTQVGPRVSERGGRNPTPPPPTKGVGAVDFVKNFLRSKNLQSKLYKRA